MNGKTPDTLYGVELVGRELAGPFALKLAIHPRDSRFEHEAQLLSEPLSFWHLRRKE